MQSIRQYRQFRTFVQNQRDHAKEKISDGPRQTSRDSSSTLHDPRTDAEKTSSTSDPPSTATLAAEANGQRAIGSPSHERQQEQAEAQVAREAEEEREEGEVDYNDDDDDDGGDYQMRQSLSRVSTGRSSGLQLGHAITGVEIRKRSTKEGGHGDVFIVGYHDETDPCNPHNWSFGKRIWTTFMIACIGFVVGFASSIDSEALDQAADAFHVSEVVESLATGLYLVGFGVGALFAGPISETVGRNPVYIVTMALFNIFIMASALAPNIGAQLVFRFLAGFFGATPLTCAGGSISDLWSPLERVYSFPVFANAAFSGPVIGPVVGGYIAQSASQLPHPQWRWCDWITLIMGCTVLVLVIFTVPETFSPILLKWKAKHLRDATGDDRYRAEVEVREESFGTRLGCALYRPFLLTAQEPIIILMSLYLTVIYIVLFTFLDGYTYIFEEIHGTSQGVTGLCFLGIELGLCFASVLVPFIGKEAKRELRKLQEQGKDKLPPEFRLKFAMYGAPTIPIGLFWMGWTSDPSISIWSPLAASVVFGFGILCVFISAYQYIIDSYELFAASALASMTLIRYVAAGGMIVVGIPFYENLGVHYTLTILGCISAACVPVPYIFYVYGHKIRQMSKYAPTD